MRSRPPEQSCTLTSKGDLHKAGGIPPLAIFMLNREQNSGTINCTKDERGTEEMPDYSFSYIALASVMRCSLEAIQIPTTRNSGKAQKSSGFWAVVILGRFVEKLELNAVFEQN